MKCLQMATLQLLVFFLEFQSAIFYSFQDLAQENMGRYVESAGPGQPIVDSLSPDIFIPYQFNSGVGNRERLLVNDVFVEDSILVGRRVDTWRHVEVSGRHYLVGRETRGVVLVQVVRRGDPGHSSAMYLLNQTRLGLEGEVGALEVTRWWNSSSAAWEAVALVTETSHQTTTVRCLRVTPTALVPFKSWENPTRGRIVDLKWVAGDTQEFLLVVTHGPGGDTTLDLSHYHLSSSHITIICKEKTRVAGLASSVATVVQGETLYLMVAAPPHAPALLRIPLHPAQGGGFEVVGRLEGAPLVTQVQSMVQSGRQFFLTNGPDPGIFLLQRNTSLTSQLSYCGDVVEWLVLPVDNHREDNVVVARSQAGEVSVLTWLGLEEGFHPVEVQPPCFSLAPASGSLLKDAQLSEDAGCLRECPWSSGAVLPLAQAPTLLLSCSSVDGAALGGLFYFNVSLHSVYGLAHNFYPLTLLSKSNDLKAEVERVGAEFERAGLSEEVRLSRGRLEGAKQEWSDLEACLVGVGELTQSLARYLELRQRNNVTLSLSLANSRLSGGVEGRLDGAEVRGKLAAQIRPGGVGPGGRQIFLDGNLQVDHLNLVVTGDANVGVTAGEVVDGHGSAPPTPELSGYRSRLTNQDKGLHNIAHDKIYGSN